MSKSEHFLRYGAIISKVRNKREATFEEINETLQREGELKGYNLTVSKRTFQRDLDEIRSIFNVDIQFNFSKKVYYIEEEDGLNDMNNRMLEAFEMFNSLNVAGNLTPYIHFEKRKPQGMEHFYSLLHAIKNRLVIRFVYQKHWETEPTKRITEPYSLKEFKGRWYLYAKDQNDNRAKIFGLDRITELEITKKRFTFPKDLNVNELFRSCFGIICPDEGKPEEVILSFEPVHGKYIKSYPLHESQQVIKDNEEELRLQLRLFITYDFVMELMSYGNKVKVISPYHLRNEICEEYEEALGQYE